MAVLSTLLSVSIIASWMLVFYFDTPINEILSHPSNDEPGLARNPWDFEPIVGVHYFGDFQETISWLLSWVKSGTSPYYLGSTYPPLSIVAMFPLVAAPSILDAWVVFGLLNILLLSLVIWLMLGKFRPTERLSFVSIGLFATVPFIANMDRGSNSAIVVALIGLSLLTYKKFPFNLAAIFFGVAIALKGYPVLLLVLPFALRDWGFVRKSLLVAVSLTALSFAILPGGFQTNISLLVSNLQQNQYQIPVVNNYSLQGLFSRLLFETSQQSALSIFTNLSVGFVWIAMVYVVARRGKAPVSVVLLLTMGSLQVIPTFAFPYSQLWVSLAAALFVTTSFRTPLSKYTGIGATGAQKVWPRFVAVLMLIYFGLTLSPIPISIKQEGLPDIDAGSLSIIVLVLIGLVTFVLSCSNMELGSIKDSHNEKVTFNKGKPNLPNDIQTSPVMLRYWIAGLSFLIGVLFLAFSWSQIGKVHQRSINEDEVRSGSEFGIESQGFIHDYFFKWNEQPLTSKPGYVIANFSGQCTPLSMEFRIGEVHLYEVVTGNWEQIGVVQGDFNQGVTIKSNADVITFQRDEMNPVSFKLPTQYPCLDPKGLWISNDKRPVTVIVSDVSDPVKPIAFYLGILLSSIGLIVGLITLIGRANPGRCDNSKLQQRLYP